jgi:hypothetical protein
VIELKQTISPERHKDNVQETDSLNVELRAFAIRDKKFSPVKEIYQIFIMPL